MLPRLGPLLLTAPCQERGRVFQICRRALGWLVVGSSPRSTFHIALTVSYTTIWPPPLSTGQPWAIFAAASIEAASTIE